MWNNYNEPKRKEYIMNKYAEFSHAKENKRKVLKRMGNKQCAKKTAYATPADAKIAGRDHDKRYKSISRPYKCQCCGRYHLTTKKKLDK